MKKKVEQLSKAKLKWFKSLQLKKHRDEEKLFVLEGDKLINDALSKAAHLFKYLVVTSNHSVSLEQIPEHTIIFLASKEDMERITNLKNPTNSLALFSYPTYDLSHVQGRILALDAIQDPGNLGTIIRTAAWFNIKTIVCSLNTVDCFNPKVVQATMGSIFDVELHYVDLIDFLKNTPSKKYAALLNGTSYTELKMENSGILIMGNEGNGISKEVELLVDHALTIPKYGQGESLNVAMATGILIAEWLK